MSSARWLVKLALTARIGLGEMGQPTAIGRKDRIDIHLSGGMLREEHVDDKVLLGGVLSMCLGSFIDEEHPMRGCGGDFKSALLP